MKYERPEMEILEFGKCISTLDIIGASQDPDSNSGDGQW